MATTDLARFVDEINRALESYPDRDWNYSRISLCIRTLDELDSHYCLTIERLETRKKAGQEALEVYHREIDWGTRHSAELGILELVSLRLNKALLDSTSDESWGYRRPVVRVIKTQEIRDQGLSTALWYEIKEVAGEEFDSR